MEPTNFFKQFNQTVLNKVKDANAPQFGGNTARGWADKAVTKMGNFFASKTNPQTSAANPTSVPSAPTAPQAPPKQKMPLGHSQNTSVGAYRSTIAPNGFDQTMPGAGEQMWNNNQNLWLQAPQLDWVNKQLPQLDPNQNPGQGSQYWNQVAGQYNNPKAQNLQPQFDAAFDRARENAVGAANAQAAARGVYGSSQALNNVGNVISDVEAARAGAASDFALRNAANQRDWTSTLGNLAFGAGNEDLSKLGLGFNTAFRSDEASRDRLNNAFAAATTAQQLQSGRANNAFGNQMTYLNTMLPFLGGQYQGMFDSDSELAFAPYDVGLAGASSAYGNKAANRSQILNDASTALSAVNGGVQLGKSLGGTSTPPPQQPAYPGAGGPYYY